LILVASLAGWGCGEAESPEGKLKRAAERAEEVREQRAEKQNEVTELRKELARQREVLKKTEAELETAREELASTQEKLQKAQARVDAYATDSALFRRIQKQLLEELDQSAIDVEVTDQVVTLQGKVATEDDREKAIEIARSAAGVEDVVDKTELATREEQQADEGSEADREERDKPESEENPD
jgi:osmotically-inducible protein OsmY